NCCGLPRADLLLHDATNYCCNRQVPVRREPLHHRRPDRTAFGSRVAQRQEHWADTEHRIHATAKFSLPCPHEQHWQEGERKNPEDQRVEACLTPLLLFLVVRAEALRVFCLGVLFGSSNCVDANTIVSASAGAFATTRTGLPSESKVTDTELATTAVT